MLRRGNIASAECCADCNNLSIRMTARLRPQCRRNWRCCQRLNTARRNVADNRRHRVCNSSPRPTIRYARTAHREELPVPRYRTNRHVNGTLANGVTAATSQRQARRRTHRMRRTTTPRANDAMTTNYVVERCLTTTSMRRNPMSSTTMSSTFEHLPEEGSAESHIDDPIRMYLMQMGEIPMLSRADEMIVRPADRGNPRPVPPSAAGQRFVLHARRGAAGKGRSRASCGWTARSKSPSPTQRRRSARSSGWRRTWPRSSTCCSRTRPTSAWPSTRSSRPAEKHAAWRRLVVRRNKIVRLVEELNLRLGRLMPIMQQLHKISERMVTIKQQLAEPEKLVSERQRGELVQELRYLMRITLESPATLARLVARTTRTAQAATTRRSASCRPPTCGWWCRSPSGTATAA